MTKPTEVQRELQAREDRLNLAQEGGKAHMLLTHESQTEGSMRAYFARNCTAMFLSVLTSLLRPSFDGGGVRGTEKLGSCLESYNRQFQTEQSAAWPDPNISALSPKLSLSASVVVCM